MFVYTILGRNNPHFKDLSQLKTLALGTKSYILAPHWVYNIILEPYYWEFFNGISLVQVGFKKIFLMDSLA